MKPKGYQFMFRARMYRSLIPVSNSVKDQRTVYSCAKPLRLMDCNISCVRSYFNNDEVFKLCDFIANDYFF